MPTFDPKENDDLCLYTYEIGKFYVAYLFDPKFVDPLKRLSESFRKLSRAHVGVLCASNLSDRTCESSWTITNTVVDRHHRRRGIATFLNLVAIDDLCSVTHREPLSTSCRKTIDKLSLHPDVMLTIDGVFEPRQHVFDISNKTGQIVESDCLKNNWEKFLLEQNRQRGALCPEIDREILFSVLDGFAVVDLSKS